MHALLYAKRVWLIQLLVVLIAGCSPQPMPINQQQPLTSPSGSYILTVPIEKNPAYNNTSVWKVTITDKTRNLLYKDEASEFVGNLKVYWQWDEDDRVWLYNSDTGYVYFWEQDNNVWVKTLWGSGRTRQIERDLTPPAELYPSYVK